MNIEYKKLSKEELEKFISEESFQASSNKDYKDYVEKEGKYYREETPVKIYDEWKTLEGFDSSVELLAFFDPNIYNNRITLHKWQVEINEQLSKARPSSIHPYKFCLCAANGSGKDAFVIASFSLWFILTKIRSRVIITSSSGVQLTNQTENYIRGLGERINSWAVENIGAPILKINKRHIICHLSGSEIILFATDEESNVEGYHPLDGGAEMAIIVNEAKSVRPEVFRGLRRCTGFSHWINVSTPGEPLGDFYNSFINWKHKVRITYFDCPHQSPEEFEADRKELGEHSPIFRSKWLALFSFTSGKYVINQEKLEKLKHKIKHNLVDEIGNEIRVGIDVALSTNGDESVISFFKGNRQLQQICIRNKDATILADNLEKHLIDNKIAKNCNSIFADDGGVGRAVLDILRRKGWQINRVLNQSPARNKKQYRNRGAEIWSKFARLVDEGLIILLEDERLYSQLSSRKYKESTAGIDKLCLQSKREMIAEGLPSPDRADACVLAFSNIKVNDFLDEAEKEEKEETKDSKKMTREEVEELLIANDLWGKKRDRKRIRGSLNAALKR